MVIKSRLRALIAEREIKEGRRLSIKRLARETRLAESTLHSLANNSTQRFDGPVLDALCAYFDVLLGDLLVYDPEGESVPMSYQFPQGRDEGIQTLTRFYPEIIGLMKPDFTSHQFILRLAQRQQKEYIGALAAYVNSDAPFHSVHTQLARKLHDFSDLIELVERNVPSPDIFGDTSQCSRWRKK